MSIISIQSHVSYGYVGNKAAVYPLQSMGYDVCPINTVNFSNHTGYGKWKGEIFSKEKIKDIFKGMEEIGVTKECIAVLSGYMGSMEICEAVYEIVDQLKRTNRNILYLCDPVIGNNHCYVKPEVLDFFKKNLKADIITPNQFEAETLSGIKINSLEDLYKISQYFHNLGIGILVITGIKIEDADIAEKIKDNEKRWGNQKAEGSEKVERAERTKKEEWRKGSNTYTNNSKIYVFLSNKEKCFLVQTNEYTSPIQINGTGDLFSSLFLGHYLSNNEETTSLLKTIYFTNNVMMNTISKKRRELDLLSIDYNKEPEILPQIVEL